MGKRINAISKEFKETFEMTFLDVIIALIGPAVGFFVACAAESLVSGKLSWPTLGTGALETGIGLLISLCILNIKHYARLKKHFNEQMKQMRIVRDRIAFDPQAVKRFVTFMKPATTVNPVIVSAVDRNEPDTWFLDENMLTYLAVQSRRVTNGTIANPFTARRILVWPKMFYTDNRYMQILIINWCLKIDTFLVPIDRIQDGKVDLIAYANRQSVAQDVKDVIINNADKLISDEEFILCLADNQLEGIAKKYQDNKVSEKELHLSEANAYGIFFDWLLSKALDAHGSQIGKVDFSAIDLGSAHFLDKVEQAIRLTVNKICP